MGPLVCGGLGRGVRIFTLALSGRSEMAKHFHSTDRMEPRNVLMVLACWMIMCGQFAPRRPEQKACSLPAQLLQPFSHSQRSETWPKSCFRASSFVLKLHLGRLSKKCGSWQWTMVHIPPFQITSFPTSISTFSPLGRIFESLYHKLRPSTIRAMPLRIIAHTQNE